MKRRLPILLAAAACFAMWHRATDVEVAQAGLTIGGLQGGGYMRSSGSQTVTGTKTFNGDVVVDGGFTANQGVSASVPNTAIGVTTPGRIEANSGQSSGRVLTGPFAADVSYGGVSIGQSSLAFATSAFYSNGTDLFINAPTTRSILFRVANGNTQLGINNGGMYFPSTQSLTVADNGAGTASPGTLTPDRSFVAITCNDANGCDITMGESGITSGAVVQVINTSTNAANFADTAGVSELAGAFAAGQYDTIRLMYVTDRWVELARSNN